MSAPIVQRTATAGVILSAKGDTDETFSIMPPDKDGDLKLEKSLGSIFLKPRDLRAVQALINEAVKLYAPEA